MASASSSQTDGQPEFMSYNMMHTEAAAERTTEPKSLLTTQCSTSLDARATRKLEDMLKVLDHRIASYVEMKDVCCPNRIKDLNAKLATARVEEMDYVLTAPSMNLEQTLAWNSRRRRFDFMRKNLACIPEQVKMFERVVAAGRENRRQYRRWVKVLVKESGGTADGAECGERARELEIAQARVLRATEKFGEAEREIREDTDRNDRRVRELKRKDARDRERLTGKFEDWRRHEKKERGGREETLGKRHTREDVD